MALLKSIFRKKNPADMVIQEQHAELLQESGMSNAKCMLINKGEPDEMKIYGYRRNMIRTILTYISFVLTLGISRLVLHWVPHWYLYATSSSCSVTQAQKLLITEIFRNRKILHICDVKILTADDVYKNEKENNVDPELIKVSIQSPPSLKVSFAKGHFKDVDSLITFSHKKVDYIWNKENFNFEKLTALDIGVSTQTLHQCQPLSEEESYKRRAVYGLNKTVIERRTIFQLIIDQISGPFYAFQGCSLALWFYDNYQWYASAVTALSVYNIFESVKQTKSNQDNLWEKFQSTNDCVVRRKNITNGGHEEEDKTIFSERLVPGDILVIPPSGCTMYCDVVLLCGNCVVNEAMLTGESVPVTKTPIPDEEILTYDAKEHARHTLFCGTKVIQTRYDKGHVLAIVIRVGYSTSKGSLIRSIIYPNPIDFKFERDSYKYVALSGFIALCAISYEIYLKLLRSMPFNVIALQALDVITISVPPALPSAMTAGYSEAQKRLKAQKIYCTVPRMINVAGSINCFCFDKTGTLTEDGLDLNCIIPTNENSFNDAVSDVKNIPFDDLFGGLVSCHSLTIIDEKIVGDPLDIQMFNSTGWTMSEGDHKYKPLVRASFVPPIGTTQRLNGVDEISIIREFPFSSSLQRMGVISRTLNKKSFDYYCKGAPEMLLNFIDKSTLPTDFHEVLEHYTQNGFRVIAMAHREINVKLPKLHKIKREELEVDLKFLGFIVFENMLKPETKPSIKELLDADIRCVMITGDNLLTAISVARDCDLLRPEESVITINCDNMNPPNLFYTLNNYKPKNSPNITSNSSSFISLDTIESQIQSHADSKKPSINNNYRFALTGKVWQAIKEHYSDLLGKILTRGTIFARMDPDQKQQVVEELQRLGYCVGMCGDGANDCSALKAADAGISLSDEESSLASPFNSKVPNINCTITLIKEGRAGLVASFGIFKFMMYYSMNQLAGVLNLTISFTNFTDWQFLWMDLGITSPLALFFGSSKAYDGPLSKQPPLMSLLSPQPVLSLLVHLVNSIALQVILFNFMRSQPWYTEPVENMQEDAVPTYDNFNVFIVICLQNIVMSLVFSKGGLFRRNIIRNLRFMTIVAITSLVTFYLALSPDPFTQKLIGLKLPPFFMYRLKLIGICCSFYLLAYSIEHYLIDGLLSKCVSRENKSMKYVQIEEELNRNTYWPPLISPEDFKATASPDNTIPDEPVKIVVEKDLKLNNKILSPVVMDYTPELVKQPIEDMTQPRELVVLGCPRTNYADTSKMAKNGKNLTFKTISENNLNKNGYYEGVDSYQADTSAAILNATPCRNPYTNNKQLSLTKTPALSEDLFSSVQSNFNNISSGSDTFQSFSASDDCSPSSSSNYNITDLPRDDKEKLLPYTNGCVNGFSSNEVSS